MKCLDHIHDKTVLFLQSLLANVESAQDRYDEEKDIDRVSEDPGFKEQVSDMHFKAGQSKRVWGELYKVGAVFVLDTSA